ncbi:enoyl-CoA hydratase-related protein [Acinetobacter sp. YZS-X1-1]|uniref:enoyl-CoA hydratase-related protein n=1 Tax=Acinetobacter sp. YZS-X1-1 TaxID=1501691 RepID=UPI00054CB213|nr:enoyl-CoA hydratase-related protein [Acinetobacter sp. YZS-X1-1]
MEKHIICQKSNGVLEIKFARPDKKNALTNVMYTDAQIAMEEALNDDSIKVILFTAMGDFFTAGNDLSEFLTIAESDDAEFNALKFIKVLGDYPKPIVAAVTGSGVGLGTTMLLHCDLVYILDKAKLFASFVNLAVVPEAGSSLLLTERIGYARAFNMFVMGESLSGTQAVNLGIANQSFDTAEEVETIARQKAEALAKKPYQAVLQTKQLMRDSIKILEKIHYENIYFTERLKSDEAKVILRNFLRI